MTTIVTVLGFDYGEKRIGLAVGQSITGTASPLAVIEQGASAPLNWAKIDALVQQWQPDLLVTGLPYQADGTIGSIGQAAKQFAQSLQQRYQLPVHLQDERFSTLEADNISQKRKTTDVDAIAASLIVQRWFTEQYGKKK